MKVELEEVEYRAAISILGGFRRYQGLIHTTTPDVTRLEFFVNDGDTRTVTDFLYGYDFQEIRILGDGNLTIANNTKIKTNTGSNKLLAADKIYRFTYFHPLWIEDS